MLTTLKIQDLQYTFIVCLLKLIDQVEIIPDCYSNLLFVSSFQCRLSVLKA